MAYHKQYDLDVRIARIFNTYGPRMREDGIYGGLVPRFLDQGLSGKPITVFGSGKQTRSFCYVTDQIEGLLKLAYSKKAIGKVVNIGNNNEITILDLAHKIKSLTKSNSDIIFQPLPQDDPTRRCPDISIANSLLEWEPCTDLESGLINFVEWFLLQCSHKPYL